MSDETWAQLGRHYDEDQIAALVCLVAMINAANRLAVIVHQKGRFLSARHVRQLDELTGSRTAARPGPYATMTVMIAAFSITPLGGEESVGASVAEAVRLVRHSGLPNETNAMFTNVEGDWDEVMSLIKACVMKVGESAPRVSLVIKIDHRPGVTGALRHKVESVERRLAAP